MACPGFAHGGEIAADATKDCCARLGPKGPGNFLLNFDHPQISLGLVVRKGQSQVVEKSENLLGSPKSSHPRGFSRRIVWAVPSWEVPEPVPKRAAEPQRRGRGSRNTGRPTRHARASGTRRAPRSRHSWTAACIARRRSFRSAAHACCSCSARNVHSRTRWAAQRLCAQGKPS
jgi:hypothetical protein